MPFARPTLTQLRQQVGTDISTSLPGADALLRYSNMGIIGAVLAGLINGQYGYLDWIAQQAVPFTASGEYLEAWAALKGVTRKPAIAATGQVALTGMDGTLVPSGTPLARADGVSYVTTADATITAGAATAPIVAAAPGAVGNASAGISMTISIGIAGVSSSGSAGSVLAGGADVEGDDDLRSRMLAAYAAPSQGGAATDYVEWALAVPGVTRCWVTPGGMGAGTILLYFMMDDAEAAHGGFPQGANGVASAETRDAPATGDQLILANAIFARQPVTALVYAVAPVTNMINLTIAGIATASVAVKAAIATAVTGALRRNARPGGVTNISSIEAAIAAVIGSAGFVLTAVTASAGTVSPGAAGNINSNAGALPVLGAINYA